MGDLTAMEKMARVDVVISAAPREFSFARDMTSSIHENDGARGKFLLKSGNLFGGKLPVSSKWRPAPNAGAMGVRPGITGPTIQG